MGAQTVTLARNSPEALITSIDISEASIAAATPRVAGRRPDQRHVPPRRPVRPALCRRSRSTTCSSASSSSTWPRRSRRCAALKTVLKPGGTITVIEGDHGSAYFHPRSERAGRAIRCLVRAAGPSPWRFAHRPGPVSAGDAAPATQDVQVSPRMVYVDASRPQLVEGFTKLTFTAMVEGVREPAIAAGLLTAEEFDAGVADLYRTAGDDGTFCYTFFKAVATNPWPAASSGT